MLCLVPVTNKNRQIIDLVVFRVFLIQEQFGLLKTVSIQFFCASSRVPHGDDTISYVCNRSRLKRNKTIRLNPDMRGPNLRRVLFQQSGVFSLKRDGEAYCC